VQALQNNHFPHSDAGIETLYRFAGFDPFSRSTYFSDISLDLGQFERFRRIMYAACPTCPACPPALLRSHMHNRPLCCIAGTPPSTPRCLA
jgi:hypothetical protein